jgi:hypothetical protein
VERGRIDEIELGPVGQHQRHRVGAPDAERGQAAGDPTHPVRVLPVGHRHRVARGPKRNLVSTLRRRQLKRLAERPRLQRQRSLQGLRSRALHGVPPRPGRVARAASVQTTPILPAPQAESKVRSPPRARLLRRAAPSLPETEEPR